MEQGLVNMSVHRTKGIFTEVYYKQVHKICFTEIYTHTWTGLEVFFMIDLVWFPSVFNSSFIIAFILLHYIHESYRDLMDTFYTTLIFVIILWDKYLCYEGYNEHELNDTRASHIQSRAEGSNS